ncbi:MAG TPA: four helix bundle protein [Candidatus Portnoybacteria bacterium]|uniref:Four helix bundle protein n=1 Tax=Candidatus Portnoybacteria bacterium CG02_land_8_20_14_3_00_45_8 TaxID=1974807 RepID=A0A2M7D6V9_9BACT|nr:MAG: four helix bundle protein [Candidatus Portnoybacteria bacterium CG02_land_8_20_14_3_00_45_8]HCX27821.1 four helix bundle protein [Candidatus Portnoybacteria bacterium]
MDINSYKDLLVWQKAHQLVKKVFKIIKSVKKDFISWELIKQLVRSATSVPANIVEGYYSHHGKNFASHLEISRGSTGETDYWLFELYDNGYLSKNECEETSENCYELIKMLSSFISKLRKNN